MRIMKMNFCRKIVCAAMTVIITAGLACTTETMAADAVVRNTQFTSAAEMQTKLGKGTGVWSPAYLTEVENYYWTFCDQNSLGSTQLTINVAKNAYRNLEMLLDDGYTMDYNTLSDYCKEYLGKLN